MRNPRAAVVLVLLAGCAPRPARTFVVGLAAPVGERDAAAARRFGLVVAEAPPANAAVEPAGDPATGEMSDWSQLRFLAARAAVRGKSGIFFVLPRPPAGREFADFPEEWQALARVARDLAAVRPILEAGREEPASVAPTPGLEEKSWLYSGRRYRLLVNAGGDPARPDPELLRDARALFEVRADPREALSPCPVGLCLAPGQALWLEGRPSWGGHGE